MAHRIIRGIVVAAVLGGVAPGTALADDQDLGTFTQTATFKLQNVTGVATSGSSVFVSDLSAGVIRFDYTGKPLATFAKGKITAPKGIAAGSDGDVFVITGTPGVVTRYLDDGTKLGREGAGGPAAQRIGDASGPIAVDAKGNLYVFDLNDQSIVSYDDTGAFLRRFSVGLKDVTGIGVTAAGDRVYVASSSAATGLQVYDASGGFITSFTFKSGLGGVAVEPNGDFVVSTTDPADPQVRRYKSDGTGGIAFKVTGGTPQQLATNCRGDYYARIASGDFAIADDIRRYGDPASAPPPCAARRPHGTFGGGVPTTGAGTDVRIDYLEVTQGVQPLDCPACSSGSQSLDYVNDVKGVPLVNKRTIVRVFADLNGGPSGGVGDVPMVLRFYLGGQETAFSPISPIQTPAAVLPGDGTTTVAERL
ncbi:MAG: tripartite motif-containing protein 71, partial [Solirubrobacteraceae bacterium]|nr:tripartite motif-containing protein 71 [Solirubrobacteraceae bacterium]